jgi:hypothetical protein
MNTSREWPIQPENFAFMSCQADNSRLQRTVKHPWWRAASARGTVQSKWSPETGDLELQIAMVAGPLDNAAGS